MHHRLVYQRKQGFTLVELAIVLVIIGIILASVMKGRDILSSAETTRQTQGFFLKWLTITNDYYKAVRRPLSDGIHTPNNAIVDGFCDNALGGYTSSRDEILDAANTVGIDPCSLIQTNLNDLTDGKYTCPGHLNPFQTMLDTEFAGKVRTYVAWMTYKLTFPDGQGSGGQETRTQNVLAFLNVPLAYAKRLDATIDGSVDGASGTCLNLSDIPEGIAVNQEVLSNPSKIVAATNNLGKKRFTTIKTFKDPKPTPPNTCTPADWPTSADHRNHIFTVGIVLDY